MGRVILNYYKGYNMGKRITEELNIADYINKVKAVSTFEGFAIMLEFAMAWSREQSRKRFRALREDPEYKSKVNQRNKNSASYKLHHPGAGMGAEGIHHTAELKKQGRIKRIPIDGQKRPIFKPIENE